MDLRRNPEIDLFIVLAYKVLRSDKPGGGRYDRLHTVFSGFNTSFRLLFPGVDPVKYCQILVDDGCIQLSPMKGGAMLKPNLRFVREAQEGQEELGVRLLRYLESLVAARSGTTGCLGRTDLSKRLEELGF